MVRQTDTTVLNPVISPEPEGGQIHLNVVKAFDLHKLKLIQKEDMLEQKYLIGNMHLLMLNHSFETCGSPDVLTSTIILKNCGAKTSPGRQERYILKTQFGAPLPDLIHNVEKQQ